MEVGAVDGDALAPLEGFELFLDQHSWKEWLVILCGVLAGNGDVLRVLENNFNGVCVVIEILQFFKSLCLRGASSAAESDAVGLC